ncbi:MAG: biotin carboxylase [Epsilonproteobacteria bacterium]|nr:MAG: biotin carboxylase [Campylobacterota bacterium]RLA64612.1 MAG: biotin carboxylase [Campylobacterota bacterium]
MIKKILIANRGEIALRIISTCREMGIKTVTIFTDIEKEYPHALHGDESFNIGSGPLSDTYLNQAKLIEIAKKSNADAIHPGYGFLSENATFARLVEKEGLIFIGPTPEHMELMGDKIGCKQALEKMDIPFVPGYHGDNQEPLHLLAKAKEIGFPLIVKASAGGGGKGMRLVLKEEEFISSLESAKREALNAFGNDLVLIEKYILKPRHIEVQVMGDTHGNYLHFYERDCSIQRRHQKIIEETPAPHLSDKIRDEITKSAASLIKEIKYRGAGTVEYLYSPEDESFYFLEMNTRLQVEHPITEMVTNCDLVRIQILVAAGKKIPLKQSDIKQTGHSIEVRLYAEDPDNEFLPSIGKVLHVGIPTLKNVRLDTGYVAGNEVTINFDPMLAKLISWGENRDMARKKIIHSLDEVSFLGIKTNREYLKRILTTPEFGEGKIFTNFVEEFKDLLGPRELSNEELALSLAAQYLSKKTVQANSEDVAGPWDNLTEFRNI